MEPPAQLHPSCQGAGDRHANTRGHAVQLHAYKLQLCAVPCFPGNLSGEKSLLGAKFPGPIKQGSRGDQAAEHTEC